MFVMSESRVGLKNPFCSHFCGRGRERSVDRRDRAASIGDKFVFAPLTDVRRLKFQAPP